MGDGQSQQVLTYDLKTLKLGAVVLLPDGGSQTYPAQLSDAGTFTHRQCAKGPLLPLVRRRGSGILPTYFQLTSRTLEMGAEALGRLDGAYPTQSTPLSLSATGLSPWNDFDDLEFVSFGEGLAIDPYEDSAATSLSGQTSLTNFSVDWNELQFTSLVNGSQSGDKASVLQLESSDANPDILVATRAATLPSFDMKDGQTTSVSGAFVPIANPLTVTVDFRGSEFDALRSNISPNTSFQYIYWDIVAQPTEMDSQAWNAPTLAVSASFDPVDTNFGSFTFGNPFPDTKTYLTYYVAYKVTESVPGTSQTFDVDASFSGTLALASLASPVRPVVGPVSTPEIAGKDAFVAESGVGLTPVLSWSRPTKGSSVTNIVTLYEVIPGGAGYQPRAVAMLATDDSQVRLPPGILQAGHNYYARIASSSQENNNWRSPLPMSVAECVTAVFTP